MNQDAPIVIYVDPEEGVPMSASMWTHPQGLFFGQPVPENLVGYTQADINASSWTVTI